MVFPCFCSGAVGIMVYGLNGFKRSSLMALKCFKLLETSIKLVSTAVAAMSHHCRPINAITNF
jgi:hypothetical protein